MVSFRFDSSFHKELWQHWSSKYIECVQVLPVLFQKLPLCIYILYIYISIFVHMSVHRIEYIYIGTVYSVTKDNDQLNTSHVDRRQQATCFSCCSSCPMYPWLSPRGFCWNLVSTFTCSSWSAGPPLHRSCFCSWQSCPLATLQVLRCTICRLHAIAKWETGRLAIEAFKYPKCPNPKKLTLAKYSLKVTGA